MTGASAVAATPLRPHGSVRVHGELWRARSTEDVDAGATVEVVGADGLTLVVKPV